MSAPSPAHIMIWTPQDCLELRQIVSASVSAVGGAGALDDMHVGTVELVGKLPDGVEQELGFPLDQRHRFAQKHRQIGQLRIHLLRARLQVAVTTLSQLHHVRSCTIVCCMYFLIWWPWRASGLLESTG